MPLKRRILQRMGLFVLSFLGLIDRFFGSTHTGIDADVSRRDPYIGLKILRERGSILRTYRFSGWLVLGFDEVQSVFKDKRFSSDMRKNRFISRLLRAGSEDGYVPTLDDPGILNLDPPDHTRIRKLVSPAFMRKYIASLEPRIREIVDDCLADAGDALDIVNQLAKPLPAIVIAELLGLPRKDLPRFQQLSSELLGLTQLEDPEAQQTATIANKILIDYFADIIEQKRKSPGQDLICQLIDAEDEGDRLSAREMYSTCVLLLLAGHETTTRLISNGMYLLLNHPEQLARLQAVPELIPNAIEEILRFEPPVQLMPRFALEDMQFNGRPIKKNQMCLVSIASANRDENANRDPDVFDVTRKDIKHVSFGYGIHLCLGLTLARLEGKIAIEALLTRFPDMTLAKQELEWDTSLLVRGTSHLYVDTNLH